MNELLSDVRFWVVTIGGGVLAAFWGIVKYIFTKHAAETKERFDKLEADVVRRQEFNQLRADFQTKHEENGKKIDNGFTRIESLIERNHKDAVDGRHGVGNQIMTLVEKVGTIQGRLGLDEFRKRDEQ